MSTGDDYVFRCPECHESLTVNRSMRAELIDRGCVICGAIVTARAFSAAPDT